MYASRNRVKNRELLLLSSANYPLNSARYLTTNKATEKYKKVTIPT